MPNEQELDAAIATHWRVIKQDERIAQLERLVFGDEKLGISSLVKVIDRLSHQVQELQEDRRRLRWTMAGIVAGMAITAGASVATLFRVGAALVP